MDHPFNIDQTCIFCQIVMGEAEASVVYQDDLVTAFLDLYPVTPGHTLVIPNHHTASIADVDSAVAGQMFVLGARIDRALRASGFKCEGVSLNLADGAVAGQAIFHTHLHVIPRFRGDSCGLRLHTGSVSMLDRESLDSQAEKIRSALAAGE